MVFVTFSKLLVSYAFWTFTILSLSVFFSTCGRRATLEFVDPSQSPLYCVTQGTGKLRKTCANTVLHFWPLWKKSLRSVLRWTGHDPTLTHSSINRERCCVTWVIVYSDSTWRGIVWGDRAARKVRLHSEFMGKKRGLTCTLTSAQYFPVYISYCIGVCG